MNMTEYCDFQRVCEKVSLQPIRSLEMDRGKIPTLFTLHPGFSIKNLLQNVVRFWLIEVLFKESKQFELLIKGCSKSYCYIIFSPFHDLQRLPTVTILGKEYLFQSVGMHHGIGVCMFSTLRCVSVKVTGSFLFGCLSGMAQFCGYSHIFQLSIQNIINLSDIASLSFKYIFDSLAPQCVMLFCVLSSLRSILTSSLHLVPAIFSAFLAF